MAYNTLKLFCLFALLVPFFVLTVVCPALTISKINLFNDTDGVLKYNAWVEYLSISIPIVLIFTCLILTIASCYVSMKLRLSYRLLALLLLIFPFLYTYFTINEMGEIPYTCPSDYSYSSAEIRIACGIHQINLICLWIYYILFIIIIIFFGLNNNISDYGSYGSGRKISISEYSEDDKSGGSVETKSASGKNGNGGDEIGGQFLTNVSLYDNRDGRDEERLLGGEQNN
ncbi:hypothetical protein Glove_535g31 [Diversispora epigaea]|uniref:MARVEL domain-containing protein n=1 Tax=Diversispora epigaea TaxID=1348612 RepID=A0A397GGN6_9GLOM|nr:hypothetical protein Glove_535g31 [Diversispora epigaea]